MRWLAADNDTFLFSTAIKHRLKLQAFGINQCESQIVDCQLRLLTNQRIKSL